MDTPTACWSCHGPVALGSAFCPTCNAVQPPGTVDHFLRLGLSRGFALDRAELDRRYFDLQRRLHPDRFRSRTPRERALSQSQAVELNRAYETLKDPLRRAAYLLELAGRARPAEETVQDPALLMEAMEAREALAEAEDPRAIDALATQAAGDVEQVAGQIDRAFAAAELDQAERLTLRLKYLRKLQDEIRLRRARFAVA